MLYSEQYQFIFVHVSKTGGSNLERALKPYSLQAPKTFSNKVLSKLYLHSDHRKHYFKQHDSILVAQRALPREEFEHCYKFALVRNPWDWLVSLYLFLKRKDDHRHNKLIRDMSFEQYVDFEIKRDSRHQHRFMMDKKDNLLLDYVGRYEELEQSFDAICSRLKIERPVIEKYGVYKRDPYQEFYNETLKEKVRQHWRKDIETFGYEYEGYQTGDIVNNYQNRSTA